MNTEQAFPQKEVICKDRKRIFCLNLGGFRALEEYMIQKTGNPDFAVTADYPWDSQKISDLVPVLWAGFYLDAKKDAEPWTLEKAEDVIEFVGIVQAKGLIELSLSLILSEEQVKNNAEKKRNPKTRK